MPEKTKVIAFYLPQFHRIPENDEWWGKGFTEWTNVKKARPLYCGHYQPRVPLNENYYDLSQSHTMMRQVNLANEYGVDGFCFYHYWFRGKKMLEKPIEELLQNKEVDTKYCLCWANESWCRNWDGNEGRSVILMKQEYGNEEDWKEHFNYLLPFFKDNRYIKVDGKPMFLIYSAKDVLCLKKMIACFEKMAIDAGFPGLHMVEVLRNVAHVRKDVGFSAWVDFEPFASLVSYGIIKKKSDNFKRIPFLRRFAYSIYDYRDYVTNMLARSMSNISSHYSGLFVGWDNTARRGSEVAIIFEHNTPKVFEHTLKELIKNSKQIGRPFIFINAWNEWAEGTYLEPDKKYGYAYLQAIRNAKRIIENE